MSDPARPARSHLASWWPVLAYAATIFGLSSIAQPPALPAGVSDKSVHAILYAGFALVLLRALAAGVWERVSTAAAGGAVALAAFYGATDELHQLFVPGRTCDVHDWLADLTGAAIAAGCVLLVVRARAARRATP
jgi:VanZ family protein